MEGLRKQGLAALSQLKFVPKPEEHELVTMTHADDPPTRVSLPLHSILDRFQQEEPAPAPATRLVKLHIRHPHLLTALEPPVLNASKDEILRLWDLLHLEPTAFQLLTKGVQGYYQHHTVTKSPDNNSGGTSGKQSHYLFCSYVYCLVWTYSAQTRTTNAVMLLRSKQGLGHINFDQSLSVLAMQSSLARHPLCLFLASIMQTMQVATAGAKGAQALISDVERKTGFYPWMLVSRAHDLVRGMHGVSEDMTWSYTNTGPGGGGGGDDLERRNLIPLDHNTPSDMTVDELSVASRNIGTVLVMLEDHFRQLKQLKLTIEEFTSGGHENNDEEQQEESINQALRLLSQQIDSYNMRLNYLRERGKNQATVVFNLMTRADTQASISLAKSAKKDSSSMKVIAVMTMAFLPATFLAALLPCLL